MDELHDNDGALPDTEPSVILLVEDEVLIRFVVADYVHLFGVFRVSESCYSQISKFWKKTTPRPVYT